MKILIIGNGFDIAHGLPTRYSDFLEFAQRASRIYTFNPEARLSDYDYDLKDWSAKEQIKEQLRKSFENRKTTRNNNVTVNERLDKFYDCIKNNVWYKYILELYKHNQIHGKNWIDFESEISLVIQAIDETHTSLDQTFFELKNFWGRENSEELKTKLDTFSSTYSSASQEDRGTVGDLRSRLYSYLEKLILALEIYLADFVEKIDIKPLEEIAQIEPNCVINFNYTRTYERLYGEKNVCHIHGICREPQCMDDMYDIDDDNNVVLGIDEYLQGDERFKRTDFSIFKKFVQRIRKHSDVAYANWFDSMEKYRAERVKSMGIEQNQFNSDVYIYGHSLDVTDKDILKKFIDHEYTRIHIYAHSKGTEGELISHLLRYIDEETVIKKATAYPRKLDFELKAVKRNERI